MVDDRVPVRGSYPALSAERDWHGRESFMPDLPANIREQVKWATDAGVAFFTLDVPAILAAKRREIESTGRQEDTGDNAPGEPVRGDDN